MTHYRFRFPTTVAPLPAKSPSATLAFGRVVECVRTREGNSIPSPIPGAFESFDAAP